MFSASNGVSFSSSATVVRDGGKKRGGGGREGERGRNVKETMGGRVG